MVALSKIKINWTEAWSNKEDRLKWWNNNWIHQLSMKDKAKYQLHMLKGKEANWGASRRTHHPQTTKASCTAGSRNSWTTNSASPMLGLSMPRPSVPTISARPVEASRMESTKWTFRRTSISLQTTFLRCLWVAKIILREVTIGSRAWRQSRGNQARQSRTVSIFKTKYRTIPMECKTTKWPSAFHTDRATKSTPEILASTHGCPHCHPISRVVSVIFLVEIHYLWT